jgi:methionyl-tRNA formyltransferase
MRAVFMGTPDFALPSLLALINGPDEVVAAVTQPDRPKGRHGIPTPPPVKVLALHHNIPVYQPERVKDKGFLSVLKGLRPDVIVVVAYGQILSRDILEIPPKGCINIHASLLPKYRGSSPINWALINGEKATGVTSMIVAEGVDAGPVLLKREVPITDDDDAISLHDKLSVAGGDLLSETMEGIRKGSLIPVPQDESEATCFPMLKKSDGLIDWKARASEIRNSVRGLVPWPGAYTYLRQGAEGKGQRVMLKIYKADVVKDAECGVRSAESLPGTVVDESEKGIIVATGEDCLLIRELQMEGKRRMTAAEFIRGHRIEKGMVLG